MDPMGIDTYSFFAKSQFCEQLERHGPFLTPQDPYYFSHVGDINEILSIRASIVEWPLLVRLGSFFLKMFLSRRAPEL